jgi:hypothetical protein
MLDLAENKHILGNAREGIYSRPSGKVSWVELAIKRDVSVEVSSGLAHLFSELMCHGQDHTPCPITGSWPQEDGF